MTPATLRPLVGLLTRFWAKIARRGLDECWLWRAGSSRSGGREVCYGCIREGRLGSRCWRANRLALLIADPGCPPEGDPGFLVWLHAENQRHSHDEASHTCDNSLCCNPRHLQWETHTENVINQHRRRTRRRAA